MKRKKSQGGRERRSEAFAKIPFFYFFLKGGGGGGGRVYVN